MIILIYVQRNIFGIVAKELIKVYGKAGIKE
jgi:hypothetical protein